MPQNRSPRPSNDLFPGVAAAAAFLLFAFALHFPLWIGAVLAVGVYAGTWLYFRQPEERARPELSEGELLAQIQSFSRLITRPTVQRRIAGISEQANGLLRYFAEHPDASGVWGAFFRECLESTLSIVRRYAELTRHLGEPDAATVNSFEEVLDGVSTAFANLRRNVVEQDVERFDTDVQVFRETLKALDEVNVLRARQGGSE
jgi:hypothetical protein